MGFSPVTAGSATTAHTHSNATGDGGALSTSATLMGAAPLFSLMVALG